MSLEALFGDSSASKGITTCHSALIQAQWQNWAAESSPTFDMSTAESEHTAEAARAARVTQDRLT